MASKPLRFHPQAEQEYLTAQAWYRERSLIAAINFETTFGQAIEQLGKLLIAGQSKWPISESTHSGNFPSASCIKSFF
jgi:hypothetical protein